MEIRLQQRGKQQHCILTTQDMLNKRLFQRSLLLRSELDREIKRTKGGLHWTCQRRLEEEREMKLYNVRVFLTNDEFLRLMSKQSTVRVNLYGRFELKHVPTEAQNTYTSGTNVRRTGAKRQLQRHKDWRGLGHHYTRVRKK